MSSIADLYGKRIAKFGKGPSKENREKMKQDIKEFFMGQPGRIEAVPTVTPEQKSLQDMILGGVESPLGKGLQNIMQLLSGDPEALKAFQAPAMRQFQQEIVPGIAERFTGMGEGAQGSSAFGQQLGQAGAGLAENLSAQRAGLQSQAMSQLQQLMGTGMQPQFQPTQIPGQEGMLQSLIKALGSGLGFGGTMLGGGGISNLMQGLGFFGGPKSRQTGQGITTTTIG